MIKGKDPEGWNQQFPVGRLTNSPGVPENELQDSSVIEGSKAVKSDSHGVFQSRTGRTDRGV